MNRFYIEKLVVSGGGHKASVIDFRPGLNFVLGPSNTGKSLVMDCMDYVFGFTPKKNRPSKIVENSYGYNCISLHLATGQGTVVLERKIGDSKISVSGTDPTVDHGSYKGDGAHILRGGKRRGSCPYEHAQAHEHGHKQGQGLSQYFHRVTS